MTRLEEIDLQPTLVGQSLSLRPLRESDFEALHAAASDPLVWEQHPEPTRYQRPVFQKFFAGAMESKGALLVTENATGSVIGTSRYYDWNPDSKEIAVGFTFLARSHWGGRANREMKELMLRHAFRWARTVWFHVGVDNMRSRKAMDKIGGRLSHFEQKEINGVVHQYAFYKIDRRDPAMPTESKHPIAIVAADAPPRTRPSVYPEPFKSWMEGRVKYPLGDLFGLTNFGVNLTRIAPNGMSALRHAHSKQDEFIYVLEGRPTLYTDEGPTQLAPGMCAGFKAGTGNGHRLVNETNEDVVYLEIGDRTPGDEAIYPDDDIHAELVDGKWVFRHKDGTPY